MFKLAVFCIAITFVSAGNLLRGFGGGLGLRGGYAGPGLALGGGYGAAGLALGGGYGAAGLALGGGYGAAGLALGGGYARSLPVGPIPAAIQSRRTFEVVPLTLSQEPAIAQTIDVEPNVQPVNFIFRSQSSPVYAQQIHTPSQPQYETTRSEEQPSLLVHEVYKPIIQELRETIQPFRKVIQDIKPVLEEVHTVVAKGEGRLRANYAAPLALAAPHPYAANAPVLRAAPVLSAAPLLAKGY